MLLYLPLSEPSVGTGKNTTMCSSASPHTLVLFPTLAAGTTHSSQKSSLPPVHGTLNTKGDHPQLSLGDYAKQAEQIQCHFN